MCCTVVVDPINKDVCKFCSRAEECARATWSTRPEPASEMTQQSTTFQAERHCKFAIPRFAEKLFPSTGLGK